MDLEQVKGQRLGWRWSTAVGLFLCALLGMLSGVSLSERPDVQTSSFLTKAYYSLGLFVVGGLDLGTPIGGPLPGRLMLWLAYFGAPLLTASAVMEAALRMMSPHRWQLKRLANHVVILGSGELTMTYLRVLRRHSEQIPVVVVDADVDAVRELELTRKFDVTVVAGDITHEFLLNSLRLDRARKILLFGDDNYLCYEAASNILAQFPSLGSKIILHCHRLRFLRAMQNTHVAQQCHVFNAYHLAAVGLVRDHLIRHFRKTAARDIVVIAGFGRFGQTVMEELLNRALSEIDTVAVIDVDAERRVLVADEQQRMGTGYRREVFQGDIAHPDVWRRLTTCIDLSRGEPVVIMGTGSTDENLRTALWIRQKYPAALIFARCNQISDFAQRVGSEHDVHSISLTKLLEDNIPLEWVH